MTLAQSKLDKQAYNKEYYRKNRERLIAAATKYAADHPEVRKRVEDNRKGTRAEYKRALKKKHPEWNVNYKHRMRASEKNSARTSEATRSTGCAASSKSISVSTNSGSRAISHSLMRPGSDWSSRERSSSKPPGRPRSRKSDEGPERCPPFPLLPSLHHGHSNAD